MLGNRRLSLASRPPILIPPATQEAIMATNDRRKRRLEKQRIRSQQNRARRKDEGKPTHEDLARALLDIALTLHLDNGRHDDLLHLMGLVQKRLAGIGFEPRVTEQVWSDLKDRYERGWSMLRRRCSAAPREAMLSEEAAS